jgi:signal transduction histidine kinase
VSFTDFCKLFKNQLIMVSPSFMPNILRIQLYLNLIIVLFSGSNAPLYSQNGNLPALLSVIKDEKANDTARILAMTELAYNYWTTKSDSTNLLASQAIKLSKGIHYSKGLGRSYFVFGTYYNNLGNSKRALAEYDSALDYSKRISDLLNIGRIYNGLGNLFANFGDYEKALNYHFRSLKIKESQNDAAGIGNSLNNIGNIYYRLGNYDKALDYCFKSLALRKSRNDSQGIAASKNNIALIYDKLGDETKSLVYFFEALRSFKEDGIQRGITYACHDIAQVYMKQKQYDKALEYLIEGLHTAELMKSTERIADFKVSFTHYYNALGRYAEVNKNAEEALRLAQESGLLDYARVAYQEMAVAAFNTGQFKQAYLFQSRFMALTDSIQNEKKIEKALEEEFNFNEEKNKLEQEKKDLIYQNRAMKQQWLLYGTLIALAGVVTIAILFYRSSRMKIKSSDLLALQRNELADKNALIVEQNKLLNEAKSQLEQKIEQRTSDLRLANQELVNQNLVMEQFSFMTAHNLRGPVARLMGLSSLYDFGSPGEPFNAEVMKRVKQASADLDEVIHDLTAILRIKSGIEDPIVTLNLKETLEKILYQLHYIIDEKNIAVKNDLDANLRVNGVLAYVQSVFYNVISNSIKYYDASRSPEIKIGGTQQVDQITVTITDNGIGFDSEDHKEKLFRPFTRFSTTREGKGLGLYLIKIQMESMGGHVQIESKMNRGTSVILIFPVSKNELNYKSQLAESKV